jgi:5-formyltetrahydrofolate cyclo-ligase
MFVNKADIRTFSNHKSIHCHQHLYLCHWITRQYWFENAKHIAFYWPMPFEINIEPLLLHAKRIGKYCYLPSLDRYEKRLSFYRFNHPDHLEIDKRGLGQGIRPSKEIRIHHLDLVLMPVIGFSHHGFRVGFGKGYYDRTLSYVRRNDKPRRVMLGYQDQMHHFSSDIWDVPAHDLILLGAGVQHFSVSTLNHGSKTCGE